MNELERAILDKLLHGDDPILHVLRDQASSAQVRDREYTGSGFFTTFSISPSAPRLAEPPRLIIGDVYAEITGLEHDAGFLLFVNTGIVDTLEGFGVDDAFPEQPHLKRAYYVRPVSGESGSLMETPTRDLAWALRDRAA